ncbi:LVIVD repeat-containing protein [Archangium gephyra]|uniref:LVIVD repeat-containing protein n=1 Tax=Archangium gephyra TaxID=48 RepID=UPI003B79F416
MTWNRVTWTTLLVCAATLLGCPPSLPDSPDASTPDAGTGYEWDGGYVPLEETGNTWTDTGPFSPCTVTAARGADCTDSSFFSFFDLSACDREPLANAGTDGLYLMTTRFDDSPPSFHAVTLRLRGDGGTQYFEGRPITGQASDGNTRFYSSSFTTSRGTTWTTMLATCEAPQAPGFTGCMAVCSNGKYSYSETFKTQRMKWRTGESEASGLELVSENPVDIGYPVDVYVTKSHAYVVSIIQDEKQGGLTVFDVSNPSAPVKVKSLQLENDAYWNGVWAKGDALYVASAARGVLVFDISEPANPRLVRTLPATHLNIHTVFVEGNRLYAAAPSKGVLLFDVTTPTEPVELGRYASNPHDVFATGDRLYISNGPYGFVVADASNPSDIRELGSFSYEPQYAHHNAVGTFGGRTIAFEGGEGPGEHLRVLDITDPANIVKIGEFQLRPEISIHNMVLVGKKLYIAWYQEGVRVLDVSNPTQPTQVAYYNTWRETDEDPGHYFSGAFGIRVPGDGFIYAVDSLRGLLILREQ